MIIVYTIACLAAIGFFFSVLLFFVARKFKVEEDPRIDEVEKLLPGANCGGCGNAGCRAFAEKIVKDSSYCGFCPVGGNEAMAKISAVLGREAQAQEPMVAVVRCAGIKSKRPHTNVYDGYSSCRVASSLYSGETGCRWGCIGLGDCAEACGFGGVSINPETGLPVIDTGLCIGCGGCVRACPKGVLELRPRGRADRRVFVACLNQDKGAATRKACTAGCIGCGKCEKVCPFDAIHVENNVAYIDFTKCRLCRKCVAECPVHAIEAVNFPAPAAKPQVPVQAEKKEEQQ